MFERKAYVYRFVDCSLNVLYVGKTVNMDRRINQHFSSRSHLAKTDLYEQVHKIEYLKCKTEYDALVKELYYINVFKPKYNKQSKIKQIIQRNDSDIWRTYKIVKPLECEYEIDKRFAKLFPFVWIGFFIGLICLWF